MARIVPGLSENGKAIGGDVDEDGLKLFEVKNVSKLPD